MTRFPITGIGWNCKAEFQFEFWTMELCFDAVSCDEIYDTVVKAFKGVYYNRRIRVIE